MPPTAQEVRNFRRKLGSTPTDFPIDEVEDIFAEAEDQYSSYTRAVIFQAALLEGRKNLLALALKETDYSQGSSSVSLGQVARNLQAMVNADQETLDNLIDGEEIGVRWGGTRSPVHRIKEVPDDFERPEFGEDITRG